MQQVNSLVNDAIDVHCHGVGRFDFTEITNLNFLEIERILASRHHNSILTLYLPENNFDDFLNMMQLFSVGKEAGLYPHISGISLEGPLLASHGGTPKIGVWSPSKEQWQRLSECGKLGLLYVIFSPDAPEANITWITEKLLQGGVLPAAGHFSKENPLNSAKKLQSIYDVVASFGECPTITDHLYNDMPHNFKHAWRL